MDASLCTCGESSGQNLHRAERLGAHQDQARAPFVHQSEITFFSYFNRDSSKSPLKVCW